MAEQQRKATDRVRLADVADAAGVAISTVSRVFSNPDRVNFQTVEQVREVADRLGYRPNPRKRHTSAAQSQSDPLNSSSSPSGSSDTSAFTHSNSAVQNWPATSGGVIALVVKDTTDGVSSQILKGAQITAMESGSAVGLIEAGQSQQRTQQLLTHLVGKVDGVILATDSPGIDFIRDYAKRVPLVVLNRPVDGVPSVVPDPRIGVVRALSMLRRYHHTAITYVSGSTSWANQSRWSCLHDIGQRMGLRMNHIGPVRPSVEGGYQAALALENSKPTAVITYNDLIAAGIVLRLTADGVRVPEDVSVIGFDNTLIAPVVTPPITSIRIPRDLLGQAAVRLLLGRESGAVRNPADAQLMEQLKELGVRNEDEQSANVTLVDTSIIVRRSVGERRAE
ncbi:LacI family DNA-binding transcriptional regulator [Bifidobacterium imperatoris]|uniref:LacI family DNA-binding transcriptional regulator n=1 Tax=Bifidobacterium imperatoris TaxID=2020965 RepID=A0A2N5IUW4_9BIFI|nr:LacI family DNA-binding transcriptional regulator [Bifidobacterium imperatoris]PLS25769.1 Periplasmic binding protein-like domain-containing protein [Bifidobacterium imperatoris]QSY58273.1 LacI family DNA-binding transcriptional regulator [Bifidobacterium imperatoris]